MIGEIIRDVKVNPLQKTIPGLECDTLADFSIIAGDLNYRLMSNYNEFIKDKSQVYNNFKQLDELSLAMA